MINFTWQAGIRSFSSFNVIDLFMLPKSILQKIQLGDFKFERQNYFQDQFSCNTLCNSAPK